MTDTELASELEQSNDVQGKQLEPNPYVGLTAIRQRSVLKTGFHALH